jgi:hypothetical protein
MHIITLRYIILPSRLAPSRWLISRSRRCNGVVSTTPSSMHTTTLRYIFSKSLSTFTLFLKHLASVSRTIETRAFTTYSRPTAVHELQLQVDIYCNVRCAVALRAAATRSTGDGLFCLVAHGSDLEILKHGDLANHARRDSPLHSHWKTINEREGRGRGRNKHRAAGRR